ncbi:MAG: exonuclease domain-containing protein [Streptosporangiaceae bacterium]
MSTPASVGAAAPGMAIRDDGTIPAIGGRHPGAGPHLPAGLLGRVDLVVVDVETTGLAADSSITEIGAVRLTRHGPAAEFAALVNPGSPIPPDVVALTGITDGLVAAAPPIGKVLPEFLRFAAGSVLAAHNAPFDVTFLSAACERSGIDWPPRAVIDTAVLARLVLGPDDVPDHKLATLAGYFGVLTCPAHRALADARATAGVLTRLLAILADRADGPAPG